jgi:hypothetical protein
MQTLLDAQVLTDLSVDSVPSYIGCVRPWGRTAIAEGLRTPTADVHELKRRQLPLLVLRARPKLRIEIREALSEIDTAEIDSCLELGDRADPLVGESIRQILWERDSLGASLNTQPAVLNGLVTWKTVVLPGIAILAPLLGILVPFFILRFLHSSISVSDYLERVKQVVLKQISIPTFVRAQDANDRVGFVLQSLFIGFTLVMFVSGLWNQVAAALHLRSIWSSLVAKGGALETAISVAGRICDRLEALDARAGRGVRHLAAAGRSAIAACGGTATGAVAMFGSVWNSDVGVRALREWFGHVDALTAIAHDPTIMFPAFLTSSSPILRVHGMAHPALYDSCVENDYVSSGHMILTGPNRGGKSTYCKAIGLNILCAQTFGFAWGAAMEFTPFDAIFSALEPCGKLGENSTFEAEIEFAKRVLGAVSLNPTAAGAARTFVMMDEIFHSTNAVDGLAASKVFLSQLYARPNVISIISTHYRALAEEYAERVDLAQMEATADDADAHTLHYTYRVIAGVSEKSSVMEILREKGLLPAPGAADTAGGCA